MAYVNGGDVEHSKRARTRGCPNSPCGPAVVMPLLQELLGLRRMSFGLMRCLVMLLAWL